MLSTLFDSPAVDIRTLIAGLDVPVSENVGNLLVEIDQLIPDLVAEPSLDPPLDADAMVRLFDSGLFMLTVPTEYGGMAASQRDYVRVMERLGRLGPAYSMTAVPHLCISIKSVATLASSELRKTVFADLKQRQKLIAFAITEECGSDVASVRCLLRRAEDGRLRLNGNKEWITNLSRAGHVVVVAQCPDLHSVPGATVLILVPLTAPGVRVSPKRDKIVANGSDTASLYFDDVVVPADGILGEPGRGMQYFSQMVQPGRLGAASALVGMARQALDAGRGIVETKMAHVLDERLDVLSATVTLAASLGDAHHPDYPHMVALTKAFVSSESQVVINMLEQVFIGSGQSVPPCVRRAREASGLFRLLKGPGEVISYQAIMALTACWRNASLVDWQAPDEWPTETAELIRVFAQTIESTFQMDFDGRNQIVLLALADLAAAIFAHLAAWLAGCQCDALNGSRSRAEEALRRLDVLLKNKIYTAIDGWFESLCHAHQAGQLPS